MNVFKLFPIERGCLVQPLNSSGWELVYEFSEQRAPMEDWVPLASKFIDSTEDGNLIPVDAPWWGGNVLVLGAKARLAMAAFLKGYVQFLPLASSARKLDIVVPTLRVPALDETKSEIVCHQDGRIMDIERHVFHASKLSNAPIFKLSQIRVSPVFVTDKFVCAWKAANLTGFKFQEVWSSGQG